MPSKSSRIRHTTKSRAISKPSAERFLLDLANLRGEWPLFQDDEVELKRPWKDGLGRLGRLTLDGEVQVKRLIEALNQFCRRYPDVLDSSYPIGVVILRDFVRKVWDASNARQRDWYIFRFRDFAHRMTERSRLVQTLDGQRIPPPVDTLPSTFPEAAGFTAEGVPSELSSLETIGFHYLPKLARRAKRCANRDCEVLPYFFGKQAQKFCSDICAIPSQREAKLSWWNKHKDEQMKKRKKKQRTKKEEQHGTKT